MLTYVYLLIFSLVTIAACYYSVYRIYNFEDYRFYENTSLLLFSLLALSLIVITVVLFVTVNDSASVDIEDEDEETSMLIKRTSAAFTLNYLTRAGY